MARSPAPSTCPLGPRLVIQPLLDPCHPAERHSGWRRATCPVLLTLTATRLIDETADGQGTNQPSGLTGRPVNTSLDYSLTALPSCAILRSLPRACGGEGLTVVNQLVEQSKTRSLENLRLLANTQRLIATSRRFLNPFFGVSGASDEAAGAPPVRWVDALRALVRDKLALGDLFVLIDARCWGGPATGESCVVCGEKIDAGIEYEIDGPAGSVFTHLVCYSLWHREADSFPRPSTT